MEDQTSKFFLPLSLLLCGRVNLDALTTNWRCFRSLETHWGYFGGRINLLIIIWHDKAHFLNIYLYASMVWDKSTISHLGPKNLSNSSLSLSSSILYKIRLRFDESFKI